MSTLEDAGPQAEARGLVQERIVTLRVEVGVRMRAEVPKHYFLKSPRKKKKKAEEV